MQHHRKLESTITVGCLSSLHQKSPPCSKLSPLVLLFLVDSALQFKTTWWQVLPLMAPLEVPLRDTGETGDSRMVDPRNHLNTCNICRFFLLGGMKNTQARAIGLVKQTTEHQLHIG